MLEDQMIYESNYQLAPDPQFETDHDYDSDQQIITTNNLMFYVIVLRSVTYCSPKPQNPIFDIKE